MGTIPAVGPHVKVDNFHPVFHARLEAFLADPRFEGYLKVFSGARTYEQQKYLYDGWVRRQQGIPGNSHFNLAANPDAWITPHYDVASGKGSWHMEQVSTVYGPKGYAVDLNFDSFCWVFFGLNPGVAANRAYVCKYIEDIAKEYLLARTVQSEEWHYQMSYSDWTTVPVAEEPKEWDEMATQAEVQAAVAAALKDLGFTAQSGGRIDRVWNEVTKLKVVAGDDAGNATLRSIVTANNGWIRSIVRALRVFAEKLLPALEKVQVLELLKAPQK